jgi:hypothetical protein
MSGTLPADLFSSANISGNDMLHFALAGLSVVVMLISAGAYIRRRDGRYFFLMLAFIFLCLDQLITLYQELYFYGLLIVIPYLGLHLVHFLELLMLASFIGALVLPFKGIKR